MASEIKHSWNGTILTIESDSGVSSMDLQGPTGKTGCRGPQGPAGIIINEQGDIDLNGYATEQYVDEKVANIEGVDLSNYYTKQETLAAMPVIPSKVSSFENDAAYVPQEILQQFAGECFEFFATKEDLEDVFNYIQENGGTSSGASSWNDLTDKPFYTTYEEPATITLTFDGNTTGKETVSALDEDGVFVKVSDSCPKDEWLIGGTLNIRSDGSTQSITLKESHLTNISNVAGFTGSGTIVGGAILIARDAVTIEEAGVEFSSGVWFMCASDTSYVSSLTYTDDGERVTPIDEKYIPDTIARTEDMLSVREDVNQAIIDIEKLDNDMFFGDSEADMYGTRIDYNENDPDGVGYVANRTHYDGRVVTINALLSRTILEEDYINDSIGELVYVSSFIPERNLLVGGQIQSIHFNSTSQDIDRHDSKIIAEPDIVDVECDSGTAYTISANIVYTIWGGELRDDKILVVTADNTVIGGYAYKKGIYFPVFKSASRSAPSTINGDKRIEYQCYGGVYKLSYIGAEGEIKQLDEKFIPDTIARVADIPVGGGVSETKVAQLVLDQLYGIFHQLHATGEAYIFPATGSGEIALGMNEDGTIKITSAM